MSFTKNIGWFVINDTRNAPGPRIQVYNVIDYLNSHPELGIYGEVVGSMKSGKEFSLEDVAQYDALMFQRAFTPTFQNLAKEARKEGIFSAFMMNDWGLGTEFPVEQQNRYIIDMSNSVDHVLAPNKLLAQEIGKRSKTPTSVIHDAYDPHNERVAYTDSKNPLIVTTVSHHLDFPEALLDSSQIYRLKVYGGQGIKAVIDGEQGMNEESIAYGKAIDYENISLCDFSNIKTHPKTEITKGLWDYKTIASELAKGEVGIIPVHKHIPNKKYKSENRPAFLMSLGLPVVVTAMPAYEEYIDNGKTGYLCKTTQDWDHALKKLQDPEKRIEIGISGREYAQSTRSIEEVAPVYANFIHNLIKKNVLE